MADKRISQLVDRGTVANNDVVPIVVSGATTTNKATISSIQTFMQGNLDLGVTSVGITIGSTGTDVNVTGSPVTSSGNITINIPTASATNRGLLSAADWTTFNNKADAGNYVTLDTTQTITAQKTFTTSGSSDTMIISHGSGSGFALDVLKAGNGEAIRVTKSSGTGNAMTISGGNFEAGTIVKTGGTSSQFLKADGSVDSSSYALNSSLSLYLPLTGGTISGQLNVGSGNLRIAAEGASNITILRNFTGTAQGQSGFNNIGFNNSNNFYFTKNLNNGCIFSFNNTAYRTYTFPDSDATIASTSNLASYLPLTGGTLTGALNGTSASFTGELSTTSGLFSISGSGATPPTGGVGLRFVSNRLIVYGGSSDITFQKNDNSGPNLTILESGAATFSSSVAVQSVGISVTIDDAGKQGYTITNSSAVRTYKMIAGIDGTSNTGFSIRNVTAGRNELLFSDAGAATFSGNLSVIRTSGGSVISSQATATNGEAQFDLQGKNSSGTVRNATFKYDNSDIIRIGTSSNIAMRFETNDTERMRITSGGVVTTQTIQLNDPAYFSNGQYGIRLVGADNGVNGTNFQIQGRTTPTGSFSTLFTCTNAGNVTISGSLSKGSGSFRIDHPLPEKKDTHHLVHSFIEGPQADNIYRGKIDLVDGYAEVNIDEASGMTEGTFIVLNGNIQCFTSNEKGWTAIRGKVEGNILKVEAQDSKCTDTISWLVIGERIDQHMKDTDWTDENGKVIVEPLKKQEKESEILNEDLPNENQIEDESNA